MTYELIITSVMYLSERVELYRDSISHNLDRLTLALDSGNYPRLEHYLRQKYKGAAFIRLCHFHYYHLKGKIEIFDYEPHRGVEALSSMETLANAYGGSAWTWQRRLLQFQVLGLVKVKRPKRDDPYNSNRQRASVQRSEEASAKDGKRHNPCNWYRIPVYDDELFAKAESRVNDLKRVKGMASIVDQYGTAEASRILDKHAGITDRMTALREAIRQAVDAELSCNGYAYPSVIQEHAACLLCGIGIDDYRIRHEKTEEVEKTIRAVAYAWKQYLPTLLEEKRIRKGMPTKQQRELFNLASLRHIVTLLEE